MTVQEEEHGRGNGADGDHLPRTENYTEFSQKRHNRDADDAGHGGQAQQDFIVESVFRSQLRQDDVHAVRNGCRIEIKEQKAEKNNQPVTETECMFFHGNTSVQDLSCRNPATEVSE